MQKFIIIMFSVSLIALCHAGSAKHAKKPASGEQAIRIPFLPEKPVIDGDLADWKAFAYNDGVWDIFRLQHTPWYDAKRNRLTNHGNEPDIENDLSARYFMAWDETYLYMGAEVHDNANDVSESKHQPKRWYYKDAIAWFIEAPRDTVPEEFGAGNHGFCFVIDTLKPDYGAWWRHGTLEETYVETPLPENAVEYAINMNPWGRGAADYILEAKIDMQKTFGKSDPNWQNPSAGDVYSMMIVHCDPDGGEYGGHLLIYGEGDLDASWSKMILSDPVTPITRKAK